MKTIAFVLSVVLAAQIGNASVVTTQLASTNVSSFASNNSGYVGIGLPASPATITLSSTVTPGNPPVLGVGTASTTVRAVDTTAGLNVNTFNWTVTTTGLVEIIRFDLSAIVPGSTDFPLGGQPLTPAGWALSQASKNSLSFVSTTGLKSPGVFLFGVNVNGIDALGPGIPPGPNTGSFTLSMSASNPEPGSLALCGLASVIAGGFGWRRRNRTDEVTPNKL